MKIICLDLICQEEWFYGFASINFNKMNYIKVPIRSLIEEPTPFSWYQMKGLLILNLYWSACVQNSQSFSRYLKKNFLEADPITPLRGRLEKKLKWHLVEIMILRNFCSIMLFKLFVVLKDLRGQRFVVLVTKIPNYVTHDLDVDLIRLRMSRTTVPLLTLISNY